MNVCKINCINTYSKGGCILFTLIEWMSLLTIRTIACVCCIIWVWYGCKGMTAQLFVDCSWVLPTTKVLSSLLSLSLRSMEIKNTTGWFCSAIIEPLRCYTYTRDWLTDWLSSFVVSKQEWRHDFRCQSFSTVQYMTLTVSANVNDWGQWRTGERIWIVLSIASLLQIK